MQQASEAHKGSDERAPDAGGVTQPPDLRQVIVLRKAEWQRIQDHVNQVNREEERLREATRRREALHRQSQEVVKLWSNTITSQVQKKLEAKKIREQIEEERRKQIDVEEAKYKEEKRREAIEKAKTQLLYQTSRVKGLHSALLLTEVLKEREAQIELKQRIKSATRDVDKMSLDVVKTNEEEASREELKAKQRRRDGEAIAEDLKNQIRENEAARERERLESKKEAEEIQRLQELHQWEQRMESEKQETQRRDLMHAHLEHMANRDVIRAKEAQKQEAEEEKRKLYLSTKQKMTKLRKEKEKEMLEEAETRRQRMLNRLMVTQQEQVSGEEERIARAAAEQDAKEALLRLEEQARKAALLKSVAEHTKLKRQEKEQRDKADKQKKQEELQDSREKLRMFSEKQELQAKRTREIKKSLQDFNASQMVEKGVRRERLRLAELELEAKNAELAAMEDEQFQLYSHGVISAAAEAQRNLFPLCKAAREGSGGGPGYLVQGHSGAQKPNCVSGTAEDMKQLHEATDIGDAKRRLGFTWWG